MINKLRITLLIIIFNLASAYADYIPPQISFSIGSISATFSENPDSTTGSGSSTSTSAPYAGAASAMPLDVNVEFFPKMNRSYFFHTSIPLMGSTPDRLYNGAFGVNWYFGTIGATAVVKDFNLELKMIPKIRYYAGAQVGVGYLVYNTKTATKSDIIATLGGQGGILYNINSKWALRGELGFDRGVGVLTSAMVIKILLGGVYNLGF